MAHDLTDAYLSILIHGDKIIMKGDTDSDQELGIVFTPQMAYDVGHQLIAAAKKLTPKHFHTQN